MAESSIEWTDYTWNPWQGCTKVSEACKHCYMFRDKRRYGQDPETVVRSARATFQAPLARFGPRSTKGAPGAFKWAPGSKVFTCSWSDFFHEAADEYRPEAWEVIRDRPDLIFLVLTKRPERIAEHLPPTWGAGWGNVAIGVTVETQRRADERIATLLQVPAWVRFLSVEPQLGPVDARDYLSRPLVSRWSGADCYPVEWKHSRQGIHWVIAGGESGPNARPSEASWFRTLRDQCAAAGVAFLFKQWGEHDQHGQRVGRRRAGRVLDGRTHDGFPPQFAALEERWR